MQEKLNAAIRPKLNKKYLTYCADTSVHSMPTVVCTQPVVLSPPSHIYLRYEPIIYGTQRSGPSVEFRMAIL